VKVVGSDLIIPSAITLPTIGRVLDAYAAGTKSDGTPGTLTEDEWDEINAIRALSASALAGLRPGLPYFTPEGEGRIPVPGIAIWQGDNPTRGQNDARILWTTLSIVGQELELKDGQNFAALTWGAPASSARYVEAVALAVVGIALVVGIAYVAVNYAPTVDRYLQRDSDLKQLRQLDAQALRFASNRLQWESAHPGVPYPFDTEAKRALDDLSRRQAEIMGNQPKPAQPPQQSQTPSWDSPWTYGLLAIGALGVYWIATNDSR
jgi:hypothetical protein